MSTDLRPDPELVGRVERATPPMSLDPDALLHAAHRHVRHRTVARAGGAVAAVVVLASAVLVTPRLTTAPDPAEPTPSPSQSARPSGEGATRTVATGLVAVNDPGDPRPATGIITSLVSGAEQRVDLGLRSGERELVLVVGGDTAGDPTGWASFYSEAEGWGGSRGGAQWTWDGETRESGARLTSEPSPGTTAELVVVPTDLPDPHVLLWSTSGFSVTNRLVTAVELPTFAAPGGQLLSATLADADLTSEMAASTTGIVFVGSDGTVVQAPCADLPVALCPQVADVPGLEAAIEAAAGEPTGRASVVDLAGGIQATTAIAPTSAGTWDTGLRLSGSWDPYGDEPLPLTLAPVSSTEVAAAAEAEGVPVTQGIRAEVGDLSSLGVFWADDDRAERFPSLYPGAQRDDMDGDVRVLVGAVPRWLPEGRVLVWLPRGVRDHDGTRIHALEPPTFDDPTGGGTRLYAVALDWGTVVSDAEQLTDALVFFVDGTGPGATGAVLEGSGRCTGLARECLDAQPDGGAALLEALAALGADVDGIEPGAGVTPPAGPTSAASPMPGFTAAIALGRDGILDLGEADGKRVWIRVASDDARLAATVYHGTSLIQQQPGALDLTYHEPWSAGRPLDDSRAMYEIGTAPQVGGWRAFLWTASRRAVELPTVDVDGRRLYALLAQELGDLVEVPSMVAWVSPDGEITVPGCEALDEAACETDAMTDGLFDDVRAALG